MISQRNRLVIMLLLLLALAAMVMLPEAANAQNSLGLGQAEQAIKPEGPFAGILFWIQQQQKAFYKAMTDALKLIRSGNGGMWVLIGLSFAYGVLHAAGPGHGKVVISSYMVANEVQLRRGILLSFASSAMQAMVAIAAIGSIVLFLRGLGLRQADLARYLEIASYAGVTALGAWLLWRDRGELRAVWAARRTAVFVGLFSMGGSFCWFLAFTLQNAAYVKALGQVELILSLMASTLFFRERISGREIAGIALLGLSILALVLAI